MVVYNERGRIQRNRTFKLGQTVIEETGCCTHLGVKCDSFLTTTKLVGDACVKLRGTLLSICNSGLNPTSVNPITMKTIYNSIVLPKSLYGCELWTNLCKTDILKLERAHMFCIKFIQSFGLWTSTDFALCSISNNSIETCIDYKKL